MKRRDFLKSLTALFAVEAAPAAEQIASIAAEFGESPSVTFEEIWKLYEQLSGCRSARDSAADPYWIFTDRPTPEDAERFIDGVTNMIRTGFVEVPEGWDQKYDVRRKAEGRR